MESYSRKEVREKLSISESTLRRWLKDLNITCVEQVLNNGVTSKKISILDYEKLIKHKQSQVGSDLAKQNDINSEYNKSMEIEIISLRMQQQQYEKVLQEKENRITDLKENRDWLQQQFVLLQEENKLLNEKLNVKNRNIFQRIFYRS